MFGGDLDAAWTGRPNPNKPEKIHAEDTQLLKLVLRYISQGSAAPGPLGKLLKPDSGIDSIDNVRPHGLHRPIVPAAEGPRVDLKARSK
jgi:hypothetical protein